MVHAYLPDGLQVQVLGLKPALWFDDACALDCDINPLVRVMCIVEQGKLHVVLPDIDLPEGHRAAILACPRLEILLELPAFLLVPVTEVYVSSDVIQELDRCRTDALGAAYGQVVLAVWLLACQSEQLFRRSYPSTPPPCLASCLLVLLKT